MTRLPRWAAPAAILAVALAGTGCGGGDGAASEPGTTTAAATTATTAGTGASGSSGTLTIDGGPKAGTYDVGFCFSGDEASLTMAASGNDQTLDVVVSGGSGSLLIANTANTELTNGTFDALSVTGDGAITGSGTYSDGAAFTLEGVCTS